MLTCGYNQDRFVDTRNEVFICQINYLVAKGPDDLPYQCSSCDQIYCRDCIQTWQKKYQHPSNKCLLGCKNNTVKQINGALKKQYLNLQIKCQYCQEICALQDLKVHETKCQIPLKQRCANFSFCGNKISMNNVCSKTCLLISKLQLLEKNNSSTQIYSCIQEFLENNFSKSSQLSKYSFSTKPQMLPISYQQENEQQQFNKQSQQIENQIKELQNQKLKFQSEINKFNQAVKTNQFIPQLPQQNQIVQYFQFSNQKIGDNILLSNQGMTITLNEQAYVFKTAIIDIGFKSGVHYWEVYLDPMTENELKVGVTLINQFSYNTAFSDQGTGFAYYGLGQLRNGNNSTGNSYGTKFKKDGVIGICLNMNKGQLSFSLNGQFQGIAFTNQLLAKGPVYPAVALLHIAKCSISHELAVPSIFPM